MSKIAFSPLVHIARLPHNPFCSIHNLHNFSHIRRPCFPDNSIHFLSICKMASLGAYHIILGPTQRITSRIALRSFGA